MIEHCNELRMSFAFCTDSATFEHHKISKNNPASHRNKDHGHCRQMLLFLFCFSYCCLSELTSRRVHSHRGSKYKTGDRYAHSDDALLRERIALYAFSHLCEQQNKIYHCVPHSMHLERKKNTPRDSLLVILQKH